jgi:hypothetical protein
MWDFATIHERSTPPKVFTVKRMAPTLCVLVTFLVLGAGCRSEECRRMQRCCDAVAGAEWSGDACGTMAEKVRDTRTCRTIVDTIRMTLESRGEPIPEPCQPNAE